MKKLIAAKFKKILSLLLTTILLLSTISGGVWAADPKVSIIIPVYNTPENLLRDCLESAKNQTLKDIEIICVDDGSTDEIGKILDEYAKNDSRFRVVHQKNSGTCVARDKGMEIAKGEYIQFLDHDDTIDPTMSEKCYNKAKEHDADIVKCGYYGTICKHCFNSNDFRVVSKLRYRRNYLGTFIWNGLYKRNYLKTNNINFKGLLAYSEDEIFNLMCFMQSFTLVRIAETLYHHIFHKTNYADVVIKNQKHLDHFINNFRCLLKKIMSEHFTADHINFFIDRCFDFGVPLEKMINSELLNQLPLRLRLKTRNALLIK